MISSFTFVSYKIDSVELKVQPNLGLLMLHPVIEPASWRMQLAIRLPMFFTNAKSYVGGLDCTLLLHQPTTPEAEATPDSALVRLKLGIAGCFSTDGRLEASVEKGLVRTQIPAILLPYLRGTATTLLANAGFGSIILPLINIQEVSDKQLQDQPIQEINS
jgi:Preprotein translocase subunit SecB